MPLLCCSFSLGRRRRLVPTSKLSEIASACLALCQTLSNKLASFSQLTSLGCKRHYHRREIIYLAPDAPTLTALRRSK